MKIIKNICNHLSYQNNSLYLENISCKTFTEKISTPFYCYSMKEIEKNFFTFKNSFKKVKPVICYAVKANFNERVLEKLGLLGAGADVVSSGEMFKAMKCGIKPENIVFSGVGKTEREINDAIKNNIMQINVESIEEIEEINKIAKKRKKLINISIRVNPDVDAKTHSKISTGRLEDKFGISIENTKKIFSHKGVYENLNINGIAIHIGSQITNLKPFEKAFKKVQKLLFFFKEKKLKIKNLDLGGGIGINYSQNPTIDIKDYVTLVESYFGNENLKLIFEPGRFIVGSSAILISKVIRIKKGLYKDFVIIDAGMNDLLRPSLYDAYHEIVPLEIKGSRKVVYDIVGPICETSDVFANKRKISELKKGDYVAICSVGAYGKCMASNYNCRKLIKEIFVADFEKNFL